MTSKWQILNFKATISLNIYIYMNSMWKSIRIDDSVEYVKRRRRQCIKKRPTPHNTSKMGRSGNEAATNSSTFIFVAWSVFKSRLCCDFGYTSLVNCVCACVSLSPSLSASLSLSHSVSVQHRLKSILLCAHFRFTVTAKRIRTNEHTMVYLVCSYGIARAIQIYLHATGIQNRNQFREAALFDIFAGKSN